MSTALLGTCESYLVPPQTILMYMPQQSRNGVSGNTYLSMRAIEKANTLPHFSAKAML